MIKSQFLALSAICLSFCQLSALAQSAVTTFTGTTNPVSHNGVNCTSQFNYSISYMGNPNKYKISINCGNVTDIVSCSNAGPSPITGSVNYTCPCGSIPVFTVTMGTGCGFNFSSTAILQQTPLPVKLKYFNGTYQNNRTTLNWKIESQSNFSHFEIERSSDGVNYNNINTTPFSNAGIYSYSDHDLSSSPVYYYRLKMVDRDGRFSYSEIISIQTKGKGHLTIAGNLVADHLTITGLNRQGEIKIFDMAGKLLLKRNVQSQAMSLDISVLKSGMYILQYADEMQAETKKFIKQ